MTFYKVDYRQNMASCGFTFHTSRRDARTAIADAVKKGTADPVKHGGSDIEKIEVRPTKVGILAALQRHAGHPDNG